MMSTQKSRREAAEYRAAHVAVVGAGYTFDLTREAADKGVKLGVLREDDSGFYFVNEPYGYYDVQDLEG